MKKRRRVRRHQSDLLRRLTELHRFRITYGPFVPRPVIERVKDMMSEIVWCAKRLRRDIKHEDVVNTMAARIGGEIMPYLDAVTDALDALLARLKQPLEAAPASDRRGSPDATC